jgi:hypothetical protein
MSRAFHGALCLLASGCWLIGDMGELSNETTGGAGAGGAASGAGGAGAGGVGASGGTGGAADCEPLALTDGDFEILAICHGLTQPRISADRQGIGVAGQLANEGFVQTFDVDGTPIASAAIRGGIALRIQVAGTEAARTTLVGGTFAEATKVSIQADESNACEGDPCAFLAAFDASMTSSAEPQFIDAGAEGSVAIEDLDTGAVGALGDAPVLAVGGTLRGSVELFGAPLMSAQESAFVVTTNIQGGTPADVTTFVVPGDPSRGVNLTINHANAPNFWVFATYTVNDQATFGVIDPPAGMFVAPPTSQVGAAKSITRTPTGAAYTVVGANALTVPRFGTVITTAGPFDGITSGRVRADRTNSLWIATAFEGTVTLPGGPPIESTGGKDPLFIVVPPGATTGVPKTLSSPSTEDDQLVDVATVNSMDGNSTTIYAVLTFEGTILIGDAPLVALPGGSTLLVRVSP